MIPSTSAPLVKAVSIRQPWAWLVAHGHKTVENRPWRTRFRGRLLIHAGGKPAKGSAEIRRLVRERFGIEIPDGLPMGGIVGAVDVVDCVEASLDPWFEGPFGWLLSHAEPIPFRPLPGQLSIFEVPRHSNPLLESAS